MGTLASELRVFTQGGPTVPRVYADANLPFGLVAAMRHDLGWDVLFVVEHDELRRAPDREHFVRALDLGRTLITLDHDFSDSMKFPAALSPGVIVCSAPDELGLMRILRYIDREIFRAPGAADQPLKGRTIVITPDLALGGC